MQAFSPEFWLIFLLIVLGMGSLAVWLPIAVRWNNYGSVLPYEPRKRVPWNFLGAAPAILFVVLAFAIAFSQGSKSADVNPNEAARPLIASAFVQLGLVVAVAMAVVFLAGGTERDLGLPCDSNQLRRDIALGVLGWLAALLPAFIVQLILLEMFGEPSQNPLIKRLQEQPNGWIFAAAIISAVIAAPIFEEFFFRVLLQGWLERVEDEAIGFRATERVSAAPQSPYQAATEPEVIEIVSDEPPAIQPESPRSGLFPGISHGFVPIVISSLLFSLAHIGFGPDPVALFVLALFLGYLYQRTHRIVPCIVVHMLFNTVNLLVLWITLQIEQP